MLNLKASAQSYPTVQQTKKYIILKLLITSPTLASRTPHLQWAKALSPWCPQPPLLSGDF